MIFLVAIGGAIGTLIRYLIFNFTSLTLTGTLLVNGIGCFGAGFFYRLLQIKNISPEYKMFILIGFIGSFTTFSAFIIETFVLLEENKIFSAISSIFLNNIIGFLAFFIGILLAKLFFY